MCITLTPHFKFDEFRCKNGEGVPPHLWNNLRLLAGNLEALRASLEKPIFINSGYRTEEYNRMVGGAKNSQHLKANAVDITVKGLLPMQVWIRIIYLMEKGLMEKGCVILYDNFVHYDRRGKIIKLNNSTMK